MFWHLQISENVQNCQICQLLLNLITITVATKRHQLQTQ